MREIKNLNVTPRDLNLLRDCYENIQLSFKQVHERHFASCARVTVVNRLAVLERNKLITSRRLGIVIHLRGPRLIGCMYHLTQSGLNVLRNHFTQESFRERPMPVSSASIVHDILLTDVITALGQIYPESLITNARLMSARADRHQRIPDAVIVSSSSKEKVAVELELSAKSDKRYRQIITAYRQDPNYQKVLYVVAKRSIEEKIKFQITGRRTLPGFPPPNTGKFEFRTLDSLLRNTTQVILKEREAMNEASV